MIVAIAGPIGSGKSFLSARLVKEAGFVKVAFADALKEECAQILESRAGTPPEQARKFYGWTGSDWTGPKSDEARKELQRYGAAARAANKSHWIERLAPKLYSAPKIVIDDARHINEIEWLVSKGAMFLTLVERANNRQLDDHASECEWRAYAYNFGLPKLTQEEAWNRVLKAM